MPHTHLPSQPDNTPLYTAVPATGTGRGVLVLHAWWGLNAFFRRTCDRLADAGFVAMAPDLYHGAVATTVEAAQQLRSQLKRPLAFQQIMQTVALLQAHPATLSGSIGVVGFSLGGTYALWLAEQPTVPVTATVTFYGTRGGDYTQSGSAFLGHFAADDAWVAASGVKKLHKALSAAGKHVIVYTYPGTTHWFAEDDRADAYAPAAAQLAWERTIAFLNAHLQ